jgi:hypothetical protein
MNNHTQHKTLQTYFSYFQQFKTLLRVRTCPKPAGRTLLWPSVSLGYMFLVSLRSSLAKHRNHGAIDDPDLKAAFAFMYSAFFELIGLDVSFGLQLDASAVRHGEETWFSGTRPFFFRCAQGSVDLSGLDADAMVSTTDSLVLNYICGD